LLPGAAAGALGEVGGACIGGLTWGSALTGIAVRLLVVVKIHLDITLRAPCRREGAGAVLAAGLAHGGVRGPG